MANGPLILWVNLANRHCRGWEMSPVVCCVVLLYVSVGILALLLLSNLSTFQSFPCMEKILGTPTKCFPRNYHRTERCPWSLIETPLSIPFNNDHWTHFWFCFLLTVYFAVICDFIQKRQKKSLMHTQWQTLRMWQWCNLILPTSFNYLHTIFRRSVLLFYFSYVFSNEWTAPLICLLLWKLISLCEEMTKSKIYDNLLWITLTQVMIYTFNRCVGKSPSGPFWFRSLSCI